MSYIQKGLNEEEVLTKVVEYFRKEGHAIEPLDKTFLQEGDPCDFVIDDEEVGKIGVAAVGCISESPFNLAAYHTAKLCYEDSIIACVRYNSHGNAVVEVDTASHILGYDEENDGIDHTRISPDPSEGSASGAQPQAESGPKLSEDPLAFARQLIAAQVRKVLRSEHFKSVEELPSQGFDLAFTAVKGDTPEPFLVRVVVCDGPHDHDAIGGVISELQRNDSAPGGILIFEYIMHSNNTTSWAINPLSTYSSNPD